MCPGYPLLTSMHEICVINFNNEVIANYFIVQEMGKQVFTAGLPI